MGTISGKYPHFTAFHLVFFFLRILTKRAAVAVWQGNAASVCLETRQGGLSVKYYIEVLAITRLVMGIQPGLANKACCTRLIYWNMHSSYMYCSGLASFPGLPLMLSTLYLKTKRHEGKSC